MEKISIARRRLEKKKSAVYVKKSNETYINHVPQGMDNVTPDLDTDCQPHIPHFSTSDPCVHPPPKIHDTPQELNTPTPTLQSPPVYTLDSLISLINEEGGLLELGKKQFTLEIVSGVEKPIKMLVSIQPVNAKPSSPDRDQDKNYLTPDEAAHALKVSKKTIYRQLKDGSLKGLKIGCRWRVILSPEGVVEGSERGNV